MSGSYKICTGNLIDKFPGGQTKLFSMKIYLFYSLKASFNNQENESFRGNSAGNSALRSAAQQLIARNTSDTRNFDLKTPYKTILYKFISCPQLFCFYGCNGIKNVNF